MPLTISVSVILNGTQVEHKSGILFTRFVQSMNVIYIYKWHCRCVCLSVCMYVCMSELNLRGLKSHDHETWHVGPLSDVDVHGLSGILIFGRVPPQAHAA